MGRRLDRVIVFHKATGQLVVRHSFSEVLATVIDEAGAWDTERPRSLIYPGRTTPETEDEYFLREVQRAIDQGKAVDVPVVILGSDIPGGAENHDKRFREAWVLNGAKVEPDMVKARIIHEDRIGIEISKQLDVATASLNEAEDDNDGPEQGRLRALRRAIRAARAFDLSTATAPDELDALWPAEVPRQTP